MLIALLVVGAVLLTGPLSANAAPPSSFSGAYSAVQAAFLSVNAAQQRGGNVTGLVLKLNGALALIQSAGAENSSNPSQAAADLQAAVTEAQQVEGAAPAVGQQGANARQLQFEVSVASAAAIVVVAAAIYLYGDRIYRRLWLRAYGSHMVKRVG